MIPQAGLTAERKKYLYEEIRLASFFDITVTEWTKVPNLV